MKRVRAIIIEKNRLLSIKRIKSGSVYWVLPGGGVEAGETLEQALGREVREELGVEIVIKGLVAQIQSEKAIGTVEFFYTARISGGELGSGDGPEFRAGGEAKGSYGIEWIELEDLPDYDLRPKEIKKYIL